jgi:hypothetical protein
MRYDFHLVSSQQFILDTSGVEISDPATVQSTVRRLIAVLHGSAGERAEPICIFG